jgi:hypothetical protein
LRAVPPEGVERLPQRPAIRVPASPASISPQYPGIEPAARMGREPLAEFGVAGRAEGLALIAPSHIREFRAVTGKVGSSEPVFDLFIAVRHIDLVFRTAVAALDRHRPDVGHEHPGELGGRADPPAGAASAAGRRSPTCCRACLACSAANCRALGGDPPT